MVFKLAVFHVLIQEGGYVFDKNDPGGETNFGISKRAYPNLDIKNLTKDQAIEIYKKDYWDKCRCDDLPEGIRLTIFDSAVNQGVNFAIKNLQSVIGMKDNEIDGIIGPKTLKALELFSEKNLLYLLTMARFRHYSNNKNWVRFGKGWIKRLLEITIYSLNK